MQLKLTHSKRPMQEVITTWDDFRRRYLTADNAAHVHGELYLHDKAELHDESGTLYIEVVK